MALPLVFCLLAAIHFWRIRKDGGISRRSLPATETPAVLPTSAPVTETGVPQGAASRAVYAAGPAISAAGLCEGRDVQRKRDLPADEVQVWPHLVVRELLMALTVIILIWVISIAFNAPLEEKANPALTPILRRPPGTLLACKSC